MKWIYMICLCVFLILIVVSDFNGVIADETKADHHQPHSSVQNHSDNIRFHVATVNFGYVQTPYIISVWILIASIAKIGFHLNNKLSSIFPESCMLIVLGVIVGLILFFGRLARFEDYVLNSSTFFLFLLPPIVLDAGYFMPNRAFFDNIGTILLYAVIGTLFNTFAVGLSLYALTAHGLDWMGGLQLDLMHCLLFSSLISAVDPVAVLAVFEAIHIDEMLHIIVFGESLLNDAVTVVLYHVFESFSEIEKHGTIVTVDIVSGCASFFVIGLVGMVIGIVFGLITGFITKYTSHVRVIEPLFVFVMSYLSYLTAEIFHFSGIMAIVFCGITMKQYVEMNMSQKSHTTVKYFMKMTANISETIIFMFLGTSTVTDTHEFNIGFIGFTLVFCLVYRAIGVVILTAIANRFRLVKLSKVDQFVMAYGGLRGAIAFSLVSLLPADIIVYKRLFVTATIVVVYFTVFIQGITIKPLVYALKVKRSTKHKPSMNEQIHARFIDHIMAGIEDISGHHGHHFLRGKFEYFNTRYIKPLLIKNAPKTRETGIFEVFTKLNIKDAMDHIARHGSFSAEHNLLNASSLTKIIRTASTGSMQSYTSSNKTSKHADEEIDPGSTVLDMQSLEARFSRKMADDSKIHHIIEENMFNPRKRWVQHRKHELLDVENHVPFHHHLRTHLRHVISTHQEKHQRRRQSRSQAKLTDPDCMRKNVSFALIEDTMNKKNEEKTLTNEVIDENLSVKSDLSDEDIGITFTASKQQGSPDSVDGEPEDQVDAIELEPTAVEKSLPWKRDTGRPPMSTSFSHSLPNDEAPHLSEAPSWVANPQYTVTPFSPIVPRKISDDVNKNEEVTLPFPWRTPDTENSNVSPHWRTNDNINDKTSFNLKISNTTDETDDSVLPPPLPWRTPDTDESTLPPPWKDSLSDPVRASPRDEDADSSPARTWAPHVPFSDENSLNGNSKHSDHINYPHVMDLPGQNTDETAPPQNVMFDKNDFIGGFDRHKRRPSFMKNVVPELPRRASDFFPREMNEEIDPHDRIANWLKNSHADLMQSPPIIDLPDIAVMSNGRPNSIDLETNL
ncbi:sodium/hydrogen exchanger 3-like isoform X2 [Tubulanus polymorphus]|uniref:sodium/hydrogen exchanger 3-like isoform X2 n=1 Tax=Tubulanus polymorphus TaxID=672921 RepID=UPI003DA3FADC